MAQRLVQIQEQKLAQQQRLSQQQLLQVKLLEMPLAEFEQSVEAEIDDNPALEPAEESPSPDLMDGDGGEPEGESFEQKQEREEREDALDAALEGLGSDDELPLATASTNAQNAEYEEIVYGDTTSFYDKLLEQIGQLDLTDRQRDILEYLAGSLDDDGYLRKELHMIADEMAVFRNLDATDEEMTEALRQLQSLDPPGIGAKNLQECLLLQIDRRPDSPRKQLMRRVVANYFTAFTKNHWDKIASSLGLTDPQTVVELRDELRRLNPKPGASMGETMGRSTQQITPDFIVETTDDGRVTFTINRGRVPELTVSPSFADMIDSYKANKQSMSRPMKEALLYAKEKVERAQSFIEAIKQRRQTLQLVMQAIIEWQYRFFVDGDEADLRPMKLNDIAQKTGLAISTVSRVSNVKYAQTRWGTFPLRHFFSEKYTKNDGEELSTRKIKVALKEIIDAEDKSKPLSDEELTEALGRREMPVARRTVAKYREQLGYPVARLRKQSL